jgi:hypothetical protein
MNFITELIKFLGSPTRGKWPVLITLVFLALAILIGYERYTATFRLGRLQKEANLITQLQEIQARGTNMMTPQLNELEATLLTNATLTIQESPISLKYVPSRLTFSFDSLWKFLFGASMWLLFALIYFFKAKTPAEKNTIKGFIVLSILSGFAGLFVPPIWWPWFHIFIFPWLFIIGFLVILLPFAILIGNYQAAKNKALTNTCINNLRQIYAAKMQWALENGKPPNDVPTENDLRRYFARTTFPKCPTGGLYTINEINSAPTCTEKGHHLA